MSIQTKVSEQSVKSLEEIKICIAYAFVVCIAITFFLGKGVIMQY